MQGRLAVAAVGPGRAPGLDSAPRTGWWAGLRAVWRGRGRALRWGAELGAGRRVAQAPAAGGGETNE